MGKIIPLSENLLVVPRGIPYVAAETDYGEIEIMANLEA